ncbi:uncharacterized protein BYT42DRAFT_376715 [Radiomyces spectabilis]|uniref:uncharacterized protein n=1 Tax=Radiomyces spectabilis TaxID=64574 RepID=UPI0022208FC4|nr:uncharacterized protein BYT42DRAFT_376715 [Radiomyces spectabilis]KAI8376157.1 hypothetical protein BYT42DRAFT_376715 [Radiomyces spectabilis]
MPKDLLSLGHLKRHQQETHDKIPKKVKRILLVYDNDPLIHYFYQRYYCQDCNDSFIDPRVLDTHIQVKHLNLLKQWPCRHSECDNKFNNKTTKRHTATKNRDTNAKTKIVT